MYTMMAPLLTVPWEERRADTNGTVTVSGLGILLNPKELKIFYNLPNIYVLHVSHCILFKNSLVREKSFTPIPQYGLIVI